MRDFAWRFVIGEKVIDSSPISAKPMHASPVWRRIDKRTVMPRRYASSYLCYLWPPPLPPLSCVYMCKDRCAPRGRRAPFLCYWHAPAPWVSRTRNYFSRKCKGLPTTERVIHPTGNEKAQVRRPQLESPSVEGVSPAPPFLDSSSQLSTRRSVAFLLGNRTQHAMHH